MSDEVKQAMGRLDWVPPWEALLAPADPGDIVHDPYEVFGAFEAWVKERYPWMESLDIYQVADLYGLCSELACRSETFGRTCEPYSNIPLKPSGQETSNHDR